MINSLLIESSSLDLKIFMILYAFTALVSCFIMIEYYYSSLNFSEICTVCSLVNVIICWLSPVPIIFKIIITAITVSTIIGLEVSNIYYLRKNNKK
ncbi:hypothetical protein [Alkaliphilus sp. B6464]|uniref:hypothetical protein n=1 Tax=Alkaliphilus sp. B6464 TaxID=2731219 RepID=UPI001BA79C5E|nr:hypothetical protein [Alkaliphilus sp. B6464]QUH21787.1 hypothetical protein HYG84_17785 [Alkaliphilus sp. B6464]